MATNPMKRQARNSFLLGMVVTLIIAAAIVAFLFMQMNKMKKENDNYKESVKSVYVLAQDVNSGDVLTSAMFKKAEAYNSSLPSDYTDVNVLLNAYSLYTKDGTKITSEYTNNTQHLYLNGDKSLEVLKDVENGKYYINRNGNKEYIETVTAPIISKINAKANTIISISMISRSNEINTDDVREQEYNMIVLPTNVVDGSYVDIRLQLPTGQDYIVVSKKRISIPSVQGKMLSDTIKVNMSEDEILTLSCAIIEAYKMDGAKLYATKYAEAGLQEAATPTYIVNNEVAALIEADPNIVTEAKNALRARYTSSLTNLRNQYINDSLSKYGKDDNVVSQMEKSITSTQESRKEYLQSLTKSNN